MEPAGADYLYNLSILAVTFATVSAIVTVVRQIRGGRLSKADVHLLTTFMSAGFVACISALLPGLLTLMRFGDEVLWTIASVGGALLHAAAISHIHLQRRKLSTLGVPPLVLLTFAGYWVSILVLIANAALADIQGVGLYAAAITLSLATSMWAFVRRIGTLAAVKTDLDWDLKAD